MKQEQNKKVRKKKVYLFVLLHKVKAKTISSINIKTKIRVPRETNGRRER